MVAASTADKGQTIVVNYNAELRQRGASYTGTSYSTDGGATFKEIQPPPFATAHGFNAGDPIVVFNSKLGKFFAGDLVTGTAAARGSACGHLTMARTGRLELAPITAVFDDRESMWADNEPTSATYGRMYISFNDFTTSCGAVDVFSLPTRTTARRGAPRSNSTLATFYPQRADHRLTARRQVGWEKQHGIHCQHG